MSKAKKAPRPASSKPARVLQVPGLAPRASEPLKAEPPSPKVTEPKDPQAAKPQKRKKGKAGKMGLATQQVAEVAEAAKVAKDAGPGGNEPESKKGGPERPAPRVLQIPGKANRGSEKRRFMSDKVSSIRSKPQEPKRKAQKGKSTPDMEDSAEFKQALKDVLNFVMPQLGKSERIQYEKAKIRALGGTPDKRQYEPYAALQRRRKAEDAARQRRLAEEKQLGVSLSATQQRRGVAADGATHRKKEALQAKKRRKENDILSVGAESRGMVIIPKSKAKTYA